MKQITLIFFVLIFSALSCNHPNITIAPPNFIKATFLGITHNYGTITQSTFGTTLGISGIEANGSGISISMINSITGTYNLCNSCGVSLANIIQIANNGEVFQSRESGSIVNTKNNSIVSGSFSGYFTRNGNIHDSTFISGSYSVGI